MSGCLQDDYLRWNPRRMSTLCPVNISKPSHTQVVKSSQASQLPLVLQKSFKIRYVCAIYLPHPLILPVHSFLLRCGIQGMYVTVTWPNLSSCVMASPGAFINVTHSTECHFYSVFRCYFCSSLLSPASLEKNSDSRNIVVVTGGKTINKAEIGTTRLVFTSKQSRRPFTHREDRKKCTIWK